MKIPLKAINITYTRTLTISPTDEMFADWDVEPTQEEFESYVLNELFFDAIYDDVRGNGTPMPYTTIERFEDVEIDWDGFESDEVNEE